MVTRIVVLVAALALLGVAAVGGPGNPSVYGWGVEVVPDLEFADFVQCSLVVYELESEKSVADLPPLRIMAGGANSMSFSDGEGLEVNFSCTVDSQQTEVAYELDGTVDGAPVLNHVATVRLK